MLPVVGIEFFLLYTDFPTQITNLLSHLVGRIVVVRAIGKSLGRGRATVEVVKDAALLLRALDGFGLLCRVHLVALVLLAFVGLPSSLGS